MSGFNYYASLPKMNPRMDAVDISGSIKPYEYNKANLGQRVGQGFRNFGDFLGENSGTIAGGALGGASIGMDAFQMANQRLNLGAPEQDLTNPAYQLGGYVSNLAGAKAQGATFGEVGSSAIKGGTLGMQIAGPWGAAVGAGLGAATSWAGGRSRKRRQQREINKANTQLATAQTAFNKSDLERNQAEISAYDYNRRSNPYRRLSNLY